MCDTMVATARVTAKGATLFAKNSDRERNEAQALELSPARHGEGRALRLTYIEIPDVAQTHACLISRPFWMWGAEMGANDKGVVIGNEAVHSIVPPSETPALIGMDLVRLGLERGSDAASALDIMIHLLERHGQGGDCGHLAPFHYHNSFIIADATDAYVLETVGRWWAVERVTGARAISNAFSIGRDASAIAPALRGHAEAEGWSALDEGFHFADRLMDRERNVVSQGVERCARATELLKQRAGQVEVADMMRILRDHGGSAETNAAWSPDAIVGRTICMHAGQGDRRSQTVGSWVGELHPRGGVHWVTGSAAPCLGIFKPMTFASGLPEQGPAPTDRFDDRTRWWRHERMHRDALWDYPDRIKSFVKLRDRLERGFCEQIDAAIAADLGEAALRAEVDACWREADAAEADWAISRRAAARVFPDGYRASWEALSGLAELPS